MANSTTDLFKEALDLDDNDRATLAGLLIESLDGEADNDVEKAWMEEVERRMVELDSGKVTTIPWEEVKSRLFQGLNGSKKA